MKKEITLDLCRKCGSAVKQGASKCRKCGSDRGTRQKSVSLGTYRLKMEKAYPSFKIKSWKWIFYVIGWIAGVLNLLFWAIMFIVWGVYIDRYSNFINPATNKFIFIWGCIYSIILGLSIAFLSLL